MKSLQQVVISLTLLTATASSLAAQDCSRYMPAVNKKLASYIAVAAPKNWKNIAFNKFGDPVNPEWGNPVLKLDAYKLPESISKRLMVRFTDSATKGTRVANGRLVCSFRFEADDGYQPTKGIINLDIEPFSNAAEAPMYHSPGEGYSGPFLVDGLAQEVVNLALNKTITRDPKYANQFQK